MLLSQINFHLKQLQDQCTVKRDPASFPEPLPVIIDRSKSLVAKPPTKLAKAKAARAARPTKITLVPPPPADLDIKSQAAVIHAQAPLVTQTVPVFEEVLDIGLEPEPQVVEPPQTIPATPIVAIEVPVYPIYELEEIKPVPFDLLSLFEKYVPKAKSMKTEAKTMGLPVPNELHARMIKFLTANKDKPGSPQSLRDLGLMCLSFAMDAMPAPQDDE